MVRSEPIPVRRGGDDLGSLPPAASSATPFYEGARDQGHRSPRALLAFRSQPMVGNPGRDPYRGRGAGEAVPGHSASSHFMTDRTRPTEVLRLKDGLRFLCAAMGPPILATKLTAQT